MPETRGNPSSRGWKWIALVAIVAAIPIVASLAVPTPRPARVTSAAPSDPSAAPSDPSAATTPAAPASGATPPAAAPGGAAGDPDLGVSTPRTPYDVAYDAIESEQSALLIEKAAIEAESARIGAKREELETFERDHPNGVPPELYAHYEDDRATFNSDVRAFKSRAAAYTMKVADLERRVEALRTAAP
ncbi:MAG TPA: hypothetical protein VI198_02320 [Candidatus Eisenbacteria bacterium]